MAHEVKSFRSPKYSQMKGNVVVSVPLGTKVQLGILKLGSFLMLNLAFFAIFFKWRLFDYNFETFRHSSGSTYGGLAKTA